MSSQRRSKAQWLELIEEQEQSGLNQTEFCKTKGINPKYFSLRRSKLLGLAQPSKAPLSPFVKLAPSSKAASQCDDTVTLNFRGIELQLHTTSAQFVAELVKALA